MNMIISGGRVNINGHPIGYDGDMNLFNYDDEKVAILDIKNISIDSAINCVLTTSEELTDMAIVKLHGNCKSKEKMKITIKKGYDDIIISVDNKNNNILVDNNLLLTLVLPNKCSIIDAPRI